MRLTQLQKLRQAIRYTGEDICETGICVILMGVVVPLKMIPEFLDNQTAFTLVTVSAIASLSIAIPVAIPLLVTGIVLQKIGTDEIS